MRSLQIAHSHIAQVVRRVVRWGEQGGGVARAAARKANGSLRLLWLLVPFSSSGFQVGGRGPRLAGRGGGYHISQLDPTEAEKKILLWPRSVSRLPGGRPCLKRLLRWISKFGIQ